MTSVTMSDADFEAVILVREENLELEFKRTLDLSSNKGKAKLAQEICALSNHGGGWIVFGREDDGEVVDELPLELVDLEQDTVNQISSTCLTSAPMGQFRSI